MVYQFQLIKTHPKEKRGGAIVYLYDTEFLYTKTWAGKKKCIPSLPALTCLPFFLYLALMEWMNEQMNEWMNEWNIYYLKWNFYELEQWLTNLIACDNFNC